MRLWAALYGLIWLAFFATLLIAWPSPPTFVLYLALVFALGLVAVTRSSATRLRETRVPGRVKRTAQASFAVSVLLVVLVALRALLATFGVGGAGILLGISGISALTFLEVASALAILSQASAAAIAFDMWEDHDFEKETEPGVVPMAPRTR